MKTLLVLRHAKSSWHDASREDHERPLNKRGRRDAPRMGDGMRDQHDLPTAALAQIVLPIDQWREFDESGSAGAGDEAEGPATRGWRCGHRDCRSRNRDRPLDLSRAGAAATRHSARRRERNDRCFQRATGQRRQARTACARADRGAVRCGESKFFRPGRERW